MDEKENDNKENDDDNLKLKRDQKMACLFMCMLVVLWGLDYIFAKNALETLDPICLLFYKYLVAALLVLGIKYKFDRGPFIRKKDIGILIACVILGEILYFYCEYSAMAYLPVSLVSIILAFVPIVSIIIERIVYKRKAGKKIVIGICVCIAGVIMIIGFDLGMLLQGRIFGYLLAFACVFSWNAYNFITASMHERYTSITLTANQLICTVILLLPYAVFNSPPSEEFTPALIGQILYLGLLSSGIGFLIQVRSLHVLGPTTTALFSNFLPVTTTFFGWILLKETIAPIQCVGGIIVVCAGYIVIKEKGKA